jgi:capsular polysaccharide biosynthesis protein
VAARRRSAVIAGLLVGLLVLIGGGVAWQQYPSEYRAATTLVVLPTGDAADSASFYDTLSQGQIVTTLAQIIDLQGSPAVTAGDVDADISVDVVPDTALIRITATSADAAAAELAADSVLEGAQPYFEQAVDPYGVEVVQSAEGTASRTGLPASALAGVVVTVALVAGVSAYVAVRTIQRARRQTAPSPGGATPAPPAPAPRPVDVQDGRRPVAPATPGRSGPHPASGEANGAANGSAPHPSNGPVTSPGLTVRPPHQPVRPQPGR